MECRLDLGSAGEYLMFGITLPGLDLTSMDENERILIKCKPATVIASRIMDSWNLSTQEKADILNVSASTTRRYAKGLIPNRNDQRNRIRDILLIHRALLILFPVNDELRLKWVKSPNKYFKDQTAAQHMKNNGTVSVREYLEGQLCQ